MAINAKFFGTKARRLAAGSTTRGIEALEGRRLFNATTIAAVLAPGSTSPFLYDTPRGSSGGQGGGDYQIGARWGQTATDGFTGTSGNPITLTWGFVADGLSIPNGGVSGEVTAPSILQARLTTLYGTLAAAQAVFQQVFDRWSALSGITYVYTGSSDDDAPFVNSPGILGVRPDVRIGGHHLDGSSNVLAYNYFPDSADMVIDTDDLTGAGYMTNTSQSSRRLRNVVAHEHGHGLGLNHVDPINTTKLMEAFVTTSFDGPQYDDILAIQASYGDPLEKGGRNETGATATDRGTLANGTTTLATGVSAAPGDLDNFKITVANNSVATFTATPNGTTYQQGPQGGATASFNGAAQANLVVSVYAANGTSLLRTSNVTGTGAAETLSGLGLPAGTYIVRVGTSGAGATQMYSLTATISGANPPPVPSAPLLAAASDTGVSNSDGITNDSTPTFTGTATIGTTIALVADGEVVGTAATTAGGTWTITASVVADGTRAFTANASTASGTSADSAPLSVTIDTAGPTVSVAYDHEVTQHLILTFGDPGDATAFSLGQAVVTRVSDPTGPLSPAPVVQLTSLTVNGAVATVGAGRVLDDGHYRLSIAAGAVTDIAGNGLAAPVSFNFAHLNGDATNNGKTDFFDLLLLSQHYGESGRTFSFGNFDYDPQGIVGFQDLLILAQHYNVVLPALVEARPPLIVSPASGTKTPTKKVSRDVLA